MPLNALKGTDGNRTQETMQQTIGTDQDTAARRKVVKIVRHADVDTLEHTKKEETSAKKNPSDEGITCLELITGAIGFLLEPVFFLTEKLLGLFSTKGERVEGQPENVEGQEGAEGTVTTTADRVEGQEEAEGTVATAEENDGASRVVPRDLLSSLEEADTHRSEEGQVDQAAMVQDNVEDVTQLTYSKDPALQVFFGDKEEDLSPLVLNKWKELDSLEDLDPNMKVFVKALVNAVWTQCEKQVTEEEGIVDDHLADKIFTQRMGKKLVLKNGELCAALRHSFEAYEEAIAIEGVSPNDRFQDIVNSTARGNFQGYKTYLLFA